jgi:photosystem II stability/assembly factor-like uncharacterized protein
MGVAFIDPLNGWAVGSGGTIRFTNDGGATWVGQPNASNMHFDAVAIIPEPACLGGAAVALLLLRRVRSARGDATRRI